MSRSEFKQPVLAIVLLLIGTSASRAEPKFIGLRKIVDGSEVIAVARYAGKPPPRKGHHVELELTRVLKGDIQPGKYRVAFDDGPSVGTNTPEFIAFFSKGLCWRFVAVPLRGDRISDTVLRVRGFYDYNAYWVDPGFVTLAQLETLLKDRTLAYQLQGAVYFPQQGKPEWEASQLEIEVIYDAVTAEATVRGLPELKGFPAHPAVSVGAGFSQGGVLLTWSRSDSPFIMQGEIMALDPKTGAFQTRFFVQRPYLLSLEQLKEYVADPWKGATYYTVRLICAPIPGEPKPRSVTLTLREYTYDSERLEGWPEVPPHARVSGGGVDRTGSGKATMSWKLPSGNELIFQFDLGVEKALAEIRESERPLLLYNLLAAEIAGKVLVREEKKERVVTTFTASLGDVQYTKLDQPRAGELLPDDSDRPRSFVDSGEDHFKYPPEIDDPEPEEISGEADESPRNRWTVWVALVVVMSVGFWLLRRRWIAAGNVKRGTNGQEYPRSLPSDGLT